MHSCSANSFPLSEVSMRTFALKGPNKMMMACLIPFALWFGRRNQGQSRLALGQGNQYTAVIPADDGIQFPVTNAGTFLDNCRADINRNPVGNLSTAIMASVTFFVLLPTAQMNVKAASNSANLVWFVLGELDVGSHQCFSFFQG